MKPISTLRLTTMTRRRLVAYVRILERDLTTRDEEVKMMKETLKQLYEESIRGP